MLQKTSQRPASAGYMSKRARVSGLHHATHMNAEQGKKLSWRGANGQQTILNELNFQAGGSLDPFSFHNPATEKDLTWS